MKLFITQESTVSFFALLSSDKTIQLHYKNEVINQQRVKNTGPSIKQQLQKNYFEDNLKAGSNFSDSSSENYTNEEIKKDYHLEEYIKTARNPAHIINMTKLPLGVHSLRIQTGKSLKIQN